MASPTSLGSTVGVPGRTAPESPDVSPARDPRDMQNVAGPKGNFSVTPALDRALADAGIPSPSAVRATVQSVPSQPVAQVVTRPRVVAPVRPRVVAPIKQPTISVPSVPEPLSDSDFHARANPVTPGLRPGDVYSGAIGSARATGGNIVSRENSWGPTTVTNKYGVTTATMPDGKQAAVGSFNPFGNSNINPGVKSVIGGLAGAALGSLVGGPPGGLLGGLLGRSVATRGLSALGGNSGRSQPGSGGAAGGGGLGAMLGGLFGGGTVGNQRGGGDAGGGSHGAGIGGGGGSGQRDRSRAY